MEHEQQRIQKSHIAIIGLGSIGSVASEVLVRTGVGKLTLVDLAKYSPSNKNRMIHAFTHTVGKWKTDVTRMFLKDINPELSVVTARKISQKNIDHVLKGCDTIILGCDDVKTQVMVARFARERGIPVVENWGLPTGNVRVFTSDTIDYESMYNLPTKGRDLEEFSQEEYSAMFLHILETLFAISTVRKHFDAPIVSGLVKGILPFPVFGTTTWLGGVLAATETIKLQIGRYRVAYAPRFAVYDPFTHTIPHQWTLGGTRTKIWHAIRGSSL